MILGIYGTGGLGREVFILATKINQASLCWDEIIFIDDFTKETVLHSRPIYSFDKFKDTFHIDNTEIIIALGEPIYREQLAGKVCASGIKLAKLIHPNVYIPEDTTIEEGCIVFDNAVISCNVRLNKNVLIQPMAIVSHDSVVGENTVISAFVFVAGNCNIGKTVFIAVSVPIKEKVSIGSYSIVGMGSTVLRDIEAHVVAVGTPARAIRKNNGKVFK